MTMVRLAHSDMLHAAVSINAVMVVSVGLLLLPFHSTNVT